MSEKLFDFFPWTLPKRDFLQPTSSSSSSSSNVFQTSTSALLQNDYIHQLLLLNQNIVCFDSSCLITSHHSGIFAWNCLLIKILRSILSVFPLDSDVVPAFNVVLVLTNNTRNHFDLLLRKHVRLIPNTIYTILLTILFRIASRSVEAGEAVVHLRGQSVFQRPGQERLPRGKDLVLIGLFYR